MSTHQHLSDTSTMTAATDLLVVVAENTGCRPCERNLRAELAYRGWHYSASGWYYRAPVAR